MQAHGTSPNINHECRWESCCIKVTPSMTGNFSLMLAAQVFNSDQQVICGNENSGGLPNKKLLQYMS